MTKRPSEKPRLSAHGRARDAEKRGRQAEALRANLKKRKIQARGRIAGEAAGGTAPRAPRPPGAKP